MDGSESAAMESEAAADELASIVEDAEEYLRLHVAKAILDKSVEEYRKANQDPVLGRAEEIFHHRTGGSFTGFVTDADGRGGISFRARRADGTVLDIEAMSEGTCDQLYLALDWRRWNATSTPTRPFRCCSTTYS